MRKTLPESIYDFPAIEGWLSDCARQGLVVEKLSGNYVSFREGVPEERRFRLEPCMDRTAKPDEELLQAYEEAGWELAASIERPKLYLWRSIRPNPAEIHTEPETEALALNWVAKQLKQELWVFGICDFLVLVILVLGSMQAGVLLPFARQGFNSMPLSWFVLLWSSGMFLSDLRVFRRLRSRLAAGIPVGHTAPYGRRTRLWRIYWVVGVLLALLCFVDTFGDSDQRFQLPEDPLPVVSASALGCPDDDGSGELHREPLTGDRLYVWQGRTADGRGTACHWEVYDLRLSFLAPQLLRDLARIEVKGAEGLSPERMEDGRFDEVRWLPADDTQYLLARRGGRVVSLRANVPEFLTDHLAELDRAMDLPMTAR
ncbi:MAG: DUF2812 domain-containing protein [Oscillospiraceae bacterium]|nr:DUF2812 domain-containing protein [Oscillospiraceae bacterium]